MVNKGEAKTKKKKKMGLIFCLGVKESSFIMFLFWGRKGVLLFLFSNTMLSWKIIIASNPIWQTFRE